MTVKSDDYFKQWEKNPMLQPYLAKVSINFAVGKSGPELERARTLCEKLTGQKPVDCRAKETVRGFGIRKGEPIGIKVTLRGEKAEEFLRSVLWAKDDKVLIRNFDRHGNLSLGIREHLDLPDVRYDPDIGVHGFDVSAIIERPGYRVARRRKKRRPLGGQHRITKEEGMAFFEKQFNLQILTAKEEEEW
jgi:large subunit ribosomal protein L5